MFTSYESYLELSNIIDFPILLDLAHLKVSCNTLGLNFNEESKKMISMTNYLHLSDNDGKSDSNKSFDKDSDIFKSLVKHNLRGKIVTLEIYESIKNVVKTKEILDELILEQNS